MEAHGRRPYQDVLEARRLEGSEHAQDFVTVHWGKDSRDCAGPCEGAGVPLSVTPVAILAATIT